ncbi:Ras- protein Rab-21 [Tulasnella sp. UAMH 9824]|nr:Ras- protein Rab-21 [Tulasnella sp. UAMH 9824]
MISPRRAMLNVVYDVTKPKSLENLRKWVEQLNLYVDPCPPMIVVGNKIDLLSADTESEQSALALTQGRNFAESIGAFKHTNASAKSGTGVKGVFEDLVYEIVFNAYMDKEEEEARPSTTGVRLDDPPPQQSKPDGCWC